MKIISTLFVSMLLLLPISIEAQEVQNNDIVVLFDNDVHGHMDGYAQLAGLRRDMLRRTPNVCVVSLGDFSQGGPLCSVSHGQFAVDVMNRVGYDYVTLGNHEFDYGLGQLDTLVSTLKAKTIVCNFKDLRTNARLFKPYAIRDFGTLRVAFIGCITPITKISDSPDSFVDKDGNDIYSFMPGELYTEIQRQTDEVRSLGADIVVLLAHLGDVDSSYETSEEVIRNTHGIDVVLDGHAHHIIPSRLVTNDREEQVLLSSTGAHFQNMGRLIINAEGKCQTDLIATATYAKADPSIPQLIKSFQATFDRLPTIANTPYDLAGFDKQHDTYDRNCQTNLGTLCADAFRVMSRADIGWVNAGGVRSSIPAGKITFKELLSAFPFENRICVCEFTGQQIVDALEYGVSRAPIDNGNYPQVSGVTYDLNISIEPNILNGVGGVFDGIGDGPRRVTNVRVLNNKTHFYEPIDPDKNYSLASIDFILLKGGCNGMLSKGRLVADDQMIDTQLLEDYLQQHLNGIIDEAYRNAKQ